MTETRAIESMMSVTRSSISVNHLFFMTAVIFLYKSVASQKRLYILTIVFQEIYFLTEDLVMWWWFEYALVAIVVLIGFFCLMIGLERMIKIVVGTSIVMVITLGWLGTMTWLSTMLATFIQSDTFFGISYANWKALVDSADSTTAVIRYVGAIIVMITYSKLAVVFNTDQMGEKMYHILLVPCTIMSVIVGIAVALLGTSIFVPAVLRVIALSVTTNVDAQSIIMLLPLFVFLQWVLSLLLVSSLGIEFRKGREEE